MLVEQNAAIDVKPFSVRQGLDCSFEKSEMIVAG
jgi:hypothetical protein